MDLLVIGGSGLLGQEVTSLIIGNGGSQHETFVHALTAGTTTGVLFTDDIRCPIHVPDLASALLELARSTHTGIHHIAGPDAVNRHELGTLIARRDGLDETRLTKGLPTRTGPPGPLDVRLTCAMTQTRLTTRLRGAREFLRPAWTGASNSCHRRRPHPFDGPDASSR